MNHILHNEKKDVHRKSLIQAYLMLAILVIISPLLTIGYDIFKIDYHILEPSIALLVIIILFFHERNVLLIEKSYGQFIPNIHKILHFLSIGTMLVFSTMDLFGNGRIVMNEIILVFIVCIPLEIYLTMSNRKRIISQLNHDSYKTLSLTKVVFLATTILTGMILLLGLQSPPLILITSSTLFSAPLFFIVLIGRELV